MLVLMSRTFATLQNKLLSINNKYRYSKLIKQQSKVEHKTNVTTIRLGQQFKDNRYQCHLFTSSQNRTCTNTVFAIQILTLVRFVLFVCLVILRRHVSDVLCPVSAAEFKTVYITVFYFKFVFYVSAPKYY